jgi:hypothetical protein
VPTLIVVNPLIKLSHIPTFTVDEKKYTTSVRRSGFSQISDSIAKPGLAQAGQNLHNF